MDFRIRPKVHLPTRVVKALRQRPRSIKGLASVERFAGRGPRFLELAPAHMTARSAWQRVRRLPKKRPRFATGTIPNLGPAPPAERAPPNPEGPKHGAGQPPPHTPP